MYAEDSIPKNAHNQVHTNIPAHTHTETRTFSPHTNINTRIRIVIIFLNQTKLYSLFMFFSQKGRDNGRCTEIQTSKES